MTDIPTEAARLVAQGRIDWQQEHTPHGPRRADAVEILAAQHGLQHLYEAGWVLIPPQPEHIVEIKPNHEGFTWAIQHSSQCRLEGRLLDCPHHHAVVEDLDEMNPAPGRYVVHLHPTSMTEIAKQSNVIVMGVHADYGRIFDA